MKKASLFFLIAVSLSGCGISDTWAVFSLSIFIKIYLELFLAVGAFIALCIMAYGMGNKVSVDRTGREATILKVQIWMIIFFATVFFFSIITYMEVPQTLFKWSMEANEALKETWEARK